MIKKSTFACIGKDNKIFFFSNAYINTSVTYNSSPSYVCVRKRHTLNLLSSPAFCSSRSLKRITVRTFFLPLFYISQSLRNSKATTNFGNRRLCYVPQILKSLLTMFRYLLYLTKSYTVRMTMPC